jgi:3-phytase
VSEWRSSAAALAVAVAAALAGCAVAPRPGLPAAEVQARGETVAVATVNDDAADDPAIWRAPDPTASLIVGTDKKAGLYVYGLDGAVRHFVDAGRVNNVDLRDGVAFADGPGILVAASDRNDLAQAKVALLRLDPATGRLAPLGTVAAGRGEAYGICLYRETGGLYAFVVLKDGTVNQVELRLDGAAPAGRIVRSMKLGTQSEGCVADERTARLYVAEEDVGIWRFDARADGATTATALGRADGKQLVADVEGLALAPAGRDGGYLVASSQGDDAFTVYRLADDAYVGRFRIATGTFGAVEETDGIDLVLGDFGAAYPGGLLVVQDGRNERGAQNFKLVAWADVVEALALR